MRYSFYLMGMKFRGLLTMDMLVDFLFNGFLNNKQIYQFKSKKYFVWILCIAFSTENTKLNVE